MARLVTLRLRRAVRPAMAMLSRLARSGTALETSRWIRPVRRVRRGMAHLMTLPLRMVRLRKVQSRMVLPGTTLEMSQLIPPARARLSTRRMRRAMARLMVPLLRLLRTMRLAALLLRVMRLRGMWQRVTLPRATRPRMVRPGVVLPLVTRLRVTLPRVTRQRGTWLRMREVLVRGTGPKGPRLTVLRGGMSLS